MQKKSSTNARRHSPWPTGVEKYLVYSSNKKHLTDRATSTYHLVATPFLSRIVSTPSKRHQPPPPPPTNSMLSCETYDDTTQITTQRKLPARHVYVPYFTGYDIMLYFTPVINVFSNLIFSKSTVLTTPKHGRRWKILVEIFHYIDVLFG